MNVLSCDTSTSTLQLALESAKGLEEVMLTDFQHSEGLLGEIDRILTLHGLGTRDLDLLVCTRGPGSFTSLRIAMATLKGIALAGDIPLVSVPTLQVMASCFHIEGLATVVAIDAKKRRYYLGLYRDGKALCPDIDGNAEDLVQALAGEDEVVVTGPDALAFSQKLSSVLPGLRLIVDEEQPRPLGHMLIELGKKRYEEVGADDIGHGPVYIRRSDAEEALLAKKSQEEEK